MAEEVTETQSSEATGLIDDLAPAMPPVEISIWWVLGPLIVALLIGGLIWHWRARIQAKIEQLTAPKPPDPAKIAREALAALRAEMGNLTMREFIDHLSKIFRNYIEGRYRMRATSQTTREFLREAANGSWIDAETREKIREFLETSDQAKFAHLTVPESTGHAFLAFVEGFIQRTEKPAKEEGAHE